VANIFTGLGEELNRNLNERLRVVNFEKLALGTESFPSSASGPYAPDPISDIWKKTNTSYSGTDCTVVIQANNELIILGNLTTFSYSIHRDKVPIRVLGRTAVKGYTAGGRTVAGSLVFTVFDRHPLLDVIKMFEYIRNPEDRYTSPVPDQLPPLDVILIFHNEFGFSSVAKLYGVEFTDEGTTHSINDIYSECIMQYCARDLDIMVAESQLKEFKDLLFARQVRGGYVDNYLASLIDYRNRVLGELESVNANIAAIDVEIGRRTFGGAFIIGGSMITGAAAGGWLGSAIGTAAGTATVVSSLTGKGNISKVELNNEKDALLKKKKSLLSELDEINTQIRHYEQNIRGWNSQNASGGSAGVDNKSADGGTSQADSLRQSAPSSNAPPMTGRGAY
jgi:hypothetical protein